MVIHEELLDFALEVLAEIIDSLHMCVAVVAALDRDYPIVTLGLFLIALFAFDHADEATRELAARESWLIHQDQYVQGITIAPKGRGHKTKVVGEVHAGRQYLTQGKYPLLRVIGIFVATALRGLDNDRQVRMLRLERRKPGRIC